MQLGLPVSDQSEAAAGFSAVAAVFTLAVSDLSSNHLLIESTMMDDRMKVLLNLTHARRGTFCTHEHSQ